MNRTTASGQKQHVSVRKATTCPPNTRIQIQILFGVGYGWLWMARDGKGWLWAPDLLPLSLLKVLIKPGQTSAASCFFHRVAPLGVTSNSKKYSLEDESSSKKIASVDSHAVVMLLLCYYLLRSQTTTPLGQPFNLGASKGQLRIRRHDHGLDMRTMLICGGQSWHDLAV